MGKSKFKCACGTTTRSTGKDVKKLLAPRKEKPNGSRKKEK